ncbi:hypothetical protein D3C80_2088670 [compost metagenome]
MANIGLQLGDLGHGDAHGVQPLQADQPHLQGKGAQFVLAGDGVLLHQANPHEADQVGVRLG